MKWIGLLLAGAALFTVCGCTGDSGTDIDVSFSVPGSVAAWATLEHVLGTSDCPDYIDVVVVVNNRTTPIEVELPTPSNKLYMTDAVRDPRASASRHTLQPGETLSVYVWFTCATTTSFTEAMTFIYYDGAGTEIGRDKATVTVDIVTQ